MEFAALAAISQFSHAGWLPLAGQLVAETSPPIGSIPSSQPITMLPMHLPSRSCIRMRIRMQDRDGKCIGNIVIGCDDGIEPMGGDVSATNWPASGSHPACENWLIAANAANSMLVGYQFDSGFSSPARNNQIQA